MKVLILTLFQCFLLASGQVCFKLAVEKIHKLQWAWSYFADLLTNWWLLGSGICLVSATILWGFILKYYDFSIAYPLTALAYIFGMLASYFIFHEPIVWTRWLGVAVIIAGVMLVVQK